MSEDPDYAFPESPRLILVGLALLCKPNDFFLLSLNSRKNIISFEHNMELIYGVISY